MSDMTTCLNDLSYIPSNNEQNEPTQGDIGETSNEPTQAIHNEFEELYASANEELYPGCDYVTRLDFMAKFTYFKVKVLQHVPDDTWLCMKESSFMLTLLIPGPKSPGKDIDVYLRPLIDDLKYLWAKPGVETIDVATGQNLEIDTYRSQFKSKFPNKDMKEEFPDWFGSQIRQSHVDNDPGVSATSELFSLACGPTPTPISVNSYVVNNVRFVVHSRDERRTTQNSDICSPGGKDGEMYYGQQEILEFLNNMTQILANGESFKNDQYILATQVKQCFYLEDMARRLLGWKVVEHVNHKKFSNRGVIVVEDDPDIIHIDNSSYLALNDLEIAALHIDGQSIDVDAPPDIIDVDEDDDIIDDKDVLPYDLADSDDEDLVNVDDGDGVAVVYSSE
ncbi:RNA-directed DNA polymerase, eukaryota [Tanacetum coccineum]